MHGKMYDPKLGELWRSTREFFLIIDHKLDTFDGPMVRCITKSGLIWKLVEWFDGNNIWFVSNA